MSLFSIWVFDQFLIWGFFLPWLGEQESIKNHIESMEAKGIDPAAMFYTDIDAMEQIDQDLQEIHTHHPQTFWSVSDSE